MVEVVVVGGLVLRRFTCWCWWEVRWWRGWRWHSVVAVGKGLLLDRIHLASGLSCGRALPAKLLVCKSDCLRGDSLARRLSMVWCQNLHSSAFSTKREKHECASASIKFKTRLHVLGFGVFLCGRSWTPNCDSVAES